MLTISKAKQCEETLFAEIKTAKSICLTTHINPDGDGLCSCLALKRILSYLGFSADIIVDDLSLDRYSYLNADKYVIEDNVSLKYDLVLVIDLHDYQRLGSRVHLVRKAEKIFILDHHEVHDDLMDCTCSWIEPHSVCTGWMLFELFRHVIDEMSDEDKLYVGMCLYTTLLNDTNNFTNANTDKHAYELASAVLKYGVIPHHVYRLFMLSRTPAEIRLVGQVLSTIEHYDDGRILFIYSTNAMLAENNQDKEATSNLTRWVQNLKGVDTIVYYREEEANLYRLSLRSKIINVHAIAVKYNGGGHLQASGCNIKGSLPELKKLMLEEIRNADKLVG